MHYVLAMVFLMALAGCSNENKRETVCLNLLKSVVSDPSALKVNSAKNIEAALSVDNLNQHVKQRYPDGAPEAVERLLEIRIEEILLHKDNFIQIDYTASEMGGPVRGDALCRYFVWNDKKAELVSFTYNNTSYYQDKFIDIFLRYGKPEGLSGLYTVE